MRKRIYLAGPISKGDMIANVRQADAAFFALLRASLAPLNPVWSVFAGSVAERRFVAPFCHSDAVSAIADSLPNGTKHADWMGADLPWVECAHAVLRLPGESKGADAETAHATAHGIPVFHSVEEVIAWAKAE